MDTCLKTLEEGFGQYDILLADVPWPMFGDPNKMAAAGKHYQLMTVEQVHALPMRKLFRDKGALFCWATCPRLDLAIHAIAAWGLHYRGVAFIWTKTRKDGQVIGAQGIPPTGTKPTSELCLLATTNKQGRPFPLLDAAVRQDVFEEFEELPEVVLAPRTKLHSEKPAEVRNRILRLYGDRPRLELFARQAVHGWHRWGLGAPESGVFHPQVSSSS